MSVADDVLLQLRVWGSAVSGDVLDTSATVAEARVDDDPLKLWDRRRKDVDNSVIMVAGRVRLVPDWWCLRWLTVEQREEATEQMLNTRTTRWERRT